jgi:hypothetical protein
MFNRWEYTVYGKYPYHDFASGSNSFENAALGFHTNATGDLTHDAWDDVERARVELGDALVAGAGSEGSIITAAEAWARWAQTPNAQASAQQIFGVEAAAQQAAADARHAAAGPADYTVDLGNYVTAEKRGNEWTYIDAQGVRGFATDNRTAADYAVQLENGITAEKRGTEWTYLDARGTVLGYANVGTGMVTYRDPAGNLIGYLRTEKEDLRLADNGPKTNPTTVLKEMIIVGDRPKYASAPQGSADSGAGVDVKAPDPSRQDSPPGVSDRDFYGPMQGPPAPPPPPAVPPPPERIPAPYVDAGAYGASFVQGNAHQPSPPLGITPSQYTDYHPGRGADYSPSGPQAHSVSAGDPEASFPSWKPTGKAQPNDTAGQGAFHNEIPQPLPPPDLTGPPPVIRPPGRIAAPLGNVLDNPSDRFDNAAAPYMIPLIQEYDSSGDELTDLVKGEIVLAENLLRLGVGGLGAMSSLGYYYRILDPHDRAGAEFLDILSIELQLSRAAGALSLGLSHLATIAEARVQAGLAADLAEVQQVGSSEWARGGQSSVLTPHDYFHINASRVPEIDGVWDVVVHGSETQFGLVQDVAKSPISVEAIVAQMVADGWKDEPVRLISCRAGALPEGPARQLADLLKVPVLAATEDVNINPRGQMFVTNENLTTVSTGTWREFPYPRRP